MKSSRPHFASAFKSSGFFALRTALLPFETLLDWTDQTHIASDDAEGPTEAALMASRLEAVGRLRAVVRRPVVREAIYLASSSTYDEIEPWLSANCARPQLERTLMRYVQRMAGRATPFGLFAGCSMGKLGPVTNLKLAPMCDYRRYSRLDNEFLAAVADALGTRDEVRRRLQYRPNTSLYRMGGSWRYVRTTAHDGNRTHALVAISGDEFLDIAIDRAGVGAAPDELADVILAANGDCDIQREEAQRYVRELIDRQVLTSDLAPIVTGPEPLEELIASVGALGDADTATALGIVSTRLAQLDAAPMGVPIDRYRELEDIASATGVRGEIRTLLQVDLLKPAPQACCGSEMIAVLGDAVDVLHRMTPPAVVSDALNRFREAFLARYERREVPLVEALDEESGIGFDRQSSDPTPLLHNIRLGGGDLPRNPLTARDTALLRMVMTVDREGRGILELQAADVEALSLAAIQPLPDGLSVMAAVADDGLVLIRHAGGPSGVNVLGRFCRMDPGLHAAVATHLADEESQHPDVLYAEIVHLPEGRLANILGRPILRRAEIPYLGRSGAGRSAQIPLADLHVSIRDGRIVLRSASRDVEVLPRMTTMHNYSRGQGIYRFLCSLQHQGVTGGVAWTWGALETAPALPRVTYGRAVLARARWRLTSSDIAPLIRGSVVERHAALNRWRARWKVPRHVVLADNDNELPVDFTNVLSVETCLHLIKSRTHAVMHEMFPCPSALAAHGPEGRFVHELIVPFVRNTSPLPSPLRSITPVLRPPAQRTFSPGSDWLYFKIFAGTASVDHLLTGPIIEAIQRMVAEGLVRRWFFLRFSDPDWHLRVRLQGVPQGLREHVLPVLGSLLDKARVDRMIWKFQLDTYEREIERYGGSAGMDWSEELFHEDSEAVIDILRQLRGDSALDTRWRVCLLSWNQLLHDLGFDLEEKYRIVSAARERYAVEFRAGKDATHAMGDRFRRERRTLEGALTSDPDTVLVGPLQALRRRSERLAPIVRELRQLETNKTLTVSLELIASSYLHVNAFRLLRSSQRQQEFVLQDFLLRLYESQRARNRKCTKGR